MIGQIFLGRYEVTRLLGEGGMGRVYLARQLDLGRQVVIKVMHDHVAQDHKFRERFQRETLLMARFHHPGAVTLYDASLNDPAGPCIVMEYVRGVNLETLLSKSGRMTALRVGRIVTQLCEVLQAAHDEGIIHRDLKPANLMIVDPDTPKERVKVMDFGLAKLIEDGPIQKVTDTNVDFAVGTPGYIAPEQVRGETMDHRGDLYSVGVMMFELLTGRLPFVGTNSMDVLLAHATEAPPRFESLVPAGWVTSGVQQVVYRVLAKNPEDRPQSAKELGESLANALRASQGLSSHPPQSLPSQGHGSHGPAGLAGNVGPGGVGTPSRPARPRSQETFQPTRPELQLDDQPTLRQERHPADEGSDLIPLELETAPVATLLWDQPAATTRPTPPPVRPEGFLMEAWMPEAIAVRKLRGFVQDVDGEILEYQPGYVRVRLGKEPPSSSLVWLGLGKKSESEIVELRFLRADPRQENKLTIEVRFPLIEQAKRVDERRRQRSAKIFIELRAYLMGGQGNS